MPIDIQDVHELFGISYVAVGKTLRRKVKRYTSHVFLKYKPKMTPERIKFLKELWAPIVGKRRILSKSHRKKWYEGKRIFKGLNEKRRKHD